MEKKCAAWEITGLIFLFHNASIKKNPKQLLWLLFLVTATENCIWTDKVYTTLPKCAYRLQHDSNPNRQCWRFLTEILANLSEQWHLLVLYPGEKKRHGSFTSGCLSMSTESWSFFLQTSSKWFGFQHCLCGTLEQITNRTVSNISLQICFFPFVSVS